MPQRLQRQRAKGWRMPANTVYVGRPGFFGNPFTGERAAKAYGVNKVGLERRGFSSERIKALHRAVRILTKSGLNTAQALDRIRAEVEIDESVQQLIAFIRQSQRGVVK